MHVVSVAEYSCKKTIFITALSGPVLFQKQWVTPRGDISLQCVGSTARTSSRLCSVP